MALGNLHYDMLSAKSCEEKLIISKKGDNDMHERNILECYNNGVGCERETKKNTSKDRSSEEHLSSENCNKVTNQ